MTVPYRSSPGSSPERTASIVTIIIGVIALVGVLLVGLITSDDSAATSLPGQQSAPGVPGSDGASGGTGPGVAGSGGVATAAPQGPQSEPSGGVATSGTDNGSSSGGASSGGRTDGADLKTNFPTPPATTPTTSYGSLTPPSDEQWYLSRSSLATVKTFYTTTFKARGGITYISPSITRDSNGAPTGYFYIYHFGDTTTVDISFDSNYLGEKPGTVLIQASVTDD